MAANNTVGVDYSRLKLLCILEGPGAAVLFHALKCGTNKSASVTLLDYLTSLPVSSTANYCKLNGEQKRKAFTRPDKNQMDNDPSCQRFDITLLHKSIRYGCENIAALNDDALWKDDRVLEGMITKIKNERNSCVHERPQITDEQLFKDKVEELKSLFIKAVQAVKVKYGVSDSDTTDVINNITTQIQDVLEAFTEKVILQMNFDKKLHLFKEMSVGHLRNTYNDFQYFDPLSFLSGSQEERVHIQTVFSELVLEEQPNPVDIDSKELLKVLTAEESQGAQFVQDQRPRLAVVSGIAGSGKTTLLTYIVSEWLKEECDRRVTHLEEYDIVLRILCRDTDTEDLEKFLDLVLPSSLSLFHEPLVTFLKNCKVLFLIDGLDEMNSISERLISSILSISKSKRNISILATSRPERVEQFLARTRQYYKQSQLSIKGIPVNRRVEFALQYSSPPNQDRLKKFIEKQGDMTLFELPLNLIFLSTLFEDDPQCITERITQSSLYTHIHEWCTEKLRHRILVHPEWGNKEPETLEMRVKRVLNEVYLMALQGLLQDRLSLSDEDTELLVSCCKREDLPSHEFLGALYTQRPTITKRMIKNRYYAPHKALQEDFAARHIMQTLQDRSLPEPGTIMSLLQGATLAETQPLDLRGLRNLFFHVAGLLATEEVPDHSNTIKEVIKLVGEAGAKWKEWLSLAAVTAFEPAILQAIAHHVTQNPHDDKPAITDNMMESAAALLPHTPTTTVDLWLKNESVNVKHVRAFNNHQCRHLALEHHYHQPADIPASDAVLRAIDRRRLLQFTGQLSVDGVALLPASLKELCLAVSSDELTASVAAAITRAIADSSLPRLRQLAIHVPMAMVTPAVAPSPLPDITSSSSSPYHGVRLVLSGVNTGLVEKVCRVAAALQPKTGPGYWGISFPDSKLEVAEWRRLLNLLKMAQVRLRLGVVIPEQTITGEEHTELNHLAQTLWGCKVCRYPGKRCFGDYIPDEDYSSDEDDWSDEDEDEESEEEDKKH